MKEITREMHELDGHSFEVYATNIFNCNVLEVAAGAGDDPLDDDAKRSTKSYIRIRDNGGTNMQYKILTDSLNRFEGIELEFRGGAELDTLIEGLEFMKQALVDAREEMYGC